MNLKILGPSTPACPSHVKTLSLAFRKFLKVEYTIVICFKDQSGLRELASLPPICVLYMPIVLMKRVGGFGRQGMLPY